MNETDMLEYETNLSFRGMELGESLCLERNIDVPVNDVWAIVSTPG